MQPIKAEPLLDFTLQTPATQCFQILLQFQDGWLENMVDMRDSLICPNMIDVRIEYEGRTKDYTMDEFLERLGFNEDKCEPEVIQSSAMLISWVTFWAFTTGVINKYQRGNNNRN